MDGHMDSADKMTVHEDFLEWLNKKFNCGELNHNTSYK